MPVGVRGGRQLWLVLALLVDAVHTQLSYMRFTVWWQALSFAVPGQTSEQAPSRPRCALKTMSN